jgi:monoamine oxidase
VIGAGAAGLSAARELARAGASVALLEAAPRPGGRIFTQHAAAWRQPIELGAEFVHGEQRELAELARAAELTLEGVPARHFAVSRNSIEPAKELSRVEEVLAGAEDLDDDCTALELLAASEVDAGTARWFSHFVEGFHAAPLDRVSARSLLKQGSPQGAQYRIREGYGALVEYLERDATLHGASIAYRTLVRDVRYRPEGVEVASDRTAYRGGAAIVALPLSILRCRASVGGVLFDPEPLELRTELSRFEMGQALRIVIRLSEPLKLHAKLPESAFLHLPGERLPTFWTGANREEPQLTAWCGGPRAQSWVSAAEALAAALRSLSHGLGVSEATLRRLVLAAHVHDFARDPNARGAYPYEVPVHSEAHEGWLPGKLPLLFAGDYLDEEGLGTVGAAVRSGISAARTILFHA